MALQNTEGTSWYVVALMEARPVSGKKFCSIHFIFLLPSCENGYITGPARATACVSDWGSSTPAGTGAC